MKFNYRLYSWIRIVLLAQLWAVPAAAQSSATQVVDATLIDVVDLTFTGTGSNSGNLVSLSYNTASDFANGVNSPAQQIKIVSTKGFNVNVKASSANFSYSGSYTQNTTMPVSILHLAMVSNNTGGTIAAPFSTFSSLSSANQSLLSNGAAGSNQLFQVQYRGMPSFAYSSGTYTINVIYTVTQI